MNYTNLYEYIINWSLFKNLKELKLFDIIIVDENINFDNNSENIINITNLKYNNKLIQEKIKDKKTLIILNRLNVDFLNEIKIKKLNISIINLWVWISSYLNKFNLESKDINIAENLWMKI
jgi:hypothetical protein